MEYNYFQNRNNQHPTSFKFAPYRSASPNPSIGGRVVFLNLNAILPATTILSFSE